MSEELIARIRALPENCSSRDIDLDLAIHFGLSPDLTDESEGKWHKGGIRGRLYLTDIKGRWDSMPEYVAPGFTEPRWGIIHGLEILDHFYPGATLEMTRIDGLWRVTLMVFETAIVQEQAHRHRERGLLIAILRMKALDGLAAIP